MSTPFSFEGQNQWLNQGHLQFSSSSPSCLSYNPCLSCSDDHKQALLQFKSMLVGETYRNSSTDANNTGILVIESWNSNSNCCRWE
ncbi:hypothetical protein AAC387_Pa01g2882 [Persea americana]